MVAYKIIKVCTSIYTLSKPSCWRPFLLHLFGQATVGNAEDDPDVKALTIALVNGRIVDATIRCAA